MTADITRQSHRPAQRYTGVRHQAGRLALDADQNEAQAIEADSLRDLIADTICAKGTPNNGYEVSGVEPVGDAFIDFAMSRGTYYLRGTRFESGPTNSYRSQADWLTQSLDSPAQPPSPDTAGRTDLVWLHGWSQTVSAVEDSELLEPGLGGPDTTVRLRAMHRIEVMPDVPDDCDEAVGQMVEAVFPGGVLDDDRCSVVSPAELTISFANVGVTEDLCRPSATAGFLGANNETFRVRISEPGRFVWGAENASAMHRIQVEADDDGNRNTIKLLNAPRDEHSWPRAGQTVEVLRWGALLDNGEKVAEPSGLFLSVVSDYDPVARTFVTSGTVPLDWDTWFTGEGAAAVSPRDEDGLDTYFYLRIWSGGGTGASPDNPMNPGTGVPLGETGIVATFTNDGLAGDYWVLAARPNVPTEIQPWSLLDGAPPHGPERLIAPLALLNWAGAAALRPTDCRHRFRPLCRVGGCSLVTVGDGHISHGDVTSIQAAIDLLPPEGGEVCIHPGDYEEHVTISERSNITITGCGRNTRWTGDGDDAPLIHISGSTGITIRRLAMTGGPVTAIDAERAVRNLVIEDVGFAVTDAPAVVSEAFERSTIRRCRMALDATAAPLADDSFAGRLAAIVCQGEDITIERCVIEAAGFVPVGRMPVGGIHIGGGSRAVRIVDNVIRNGNGHGITLGSIQYVVFDEDFDPSTTTTGSDAPKGNVPFTVAARVPQFARYQAPLTLTNDCPDWSPVPPEVPPSADEPDEVAIPISGGLIRNLAIEGNRIEQVGYSGISAHYFIGLGLRRAIAAEKAPNDGVLLEQVRIHDNIIVNNMRNPVGERSPLVDLLVGWGGIALSMCHDGVIRDNTIMNNGAVRGDPVSGVFVGVAEDVRLEGNRIEANGVPAVSENGDPGSRRAGIAVGVAIGGQSSVSAQSPERDVDRPALVVSHNMVDAPSARALRATMIGPSMVFGNRLVGAGRSALLTNLVGSLFGLQSNLTQVALGAFGPAAGDIDLEDVGAVGLLSDILGGDAVNLVSLGHFEDLAAIRTLAGGAEQTAQSRMRGGELAFNNNQVSFRSHHPEATGSFSAVLLMNGDDISVASNQIEVENEVAFCFVNTLTISATQRVLGNRFQEPPARCFLSALTWSSMLNTTTNNQSTHCLYVVSPVAGRVDTDNRSMLDIEAPAVCRQIHESALSLSNQRRST